MSLPLLHAGRTNPGLSAALDLRFALDKSLTAYRGPTPSFSRASTGSYFDGSGVLRYAALNLLQYSEQFNDAYWTKDNCSITSNIILAPDGKLTADKVVENSLNNAHYVFRTTSNNSGIYTKSVYMKAGERTWGWVYLESGASALAYFNLENGTIGNVTGTLSPSATITNVGNGWYRCSITANVPTNNFATGFGLTSSNGVLLYLGNGTSGIYAWGAQLEASSTVGTYCPTTSSANSAPRFNHTFNGTSWVSRGLLVEEQRTNLCLYSNPYAAAADRWGTSFATLTPNAVISPDGTQNATSVVGVNSAPYFQTYYYFNQTSGTYTQSFFLKSNGANIVGVIDFTGNGFVGWYDLLNGNTQSGSYGGVTYSTTITNVGSGWYRCTVTNQSAVSMPWIHLRPVTAMGGTTNISGNGVSGFYVYGVQGEAGSFATSLISTNGSATTRSADVCQITGTDFSGFWNGTEGSVAVEYDRLAAVDSNFSSGYPRIVTAVKTSDTSRAVTLFASQSPSGEAFFVQDGTVQAWFSAGSLASANVSMKLSTGYKANDFAASLNGAAVATDASGTIPSGIDRMDIGNEYGVTRFHNGHIARLRYYNKRLPNATLQLLSDPDPTLNLQFALNKALTPVAGPAPSFSRASTGSYFDSTGTLKYANVNIATYSEQFDHSSWSYKTRLSITPNYGLAPDGTNTADLAYITSSGAYSEVGKSCGSISTPATASVYVKTFGKSWVNLQTADGSSSSWFNISTGQLGSTTGSISNRSIISVGNGWYRISVTGNGSGSGFIFIQPCDSNGSQAVTANGTDGLLLWGAQLETGSSPSQYAKTEASTTAGPRFDHVYSGGQWVSRGLLLEEQRTNLLLWSTDLSTWTDAGSAVRTLNIAVAPDGTTTAARIAKSATAAFCYIGKTLSPITNGATYTASIYAKYAGKPYLNIYGPDGSITVWFNIQNGTMGQTTGSTGYSITNVGNGWYRCSATFLTTSTTAYSYFGVSDANASTNCSQSGTDGIYLWGPQFELGAFPTSYIPTTTSSVTRSADVCQITGTSFNWMWNQGEGSVIAEYDRLTSPSTWSHSSWVFDANNGSAAERILILGNSGVPAEQVYIRDNSVDQVIENIGALPSGGVVSKAAIAFKLNDFAGTINGGAIVADGTITVPSPTKIDIGFTSYTTQTELNGHIAKLIYYPARLTNTKLQQLST